MSMNRPARMLLPALVMIALGGALAACHKSESPVAQSGQNAPESTESAVSSDTSAPGGRLVLAVIAGRPSAAYIAWRNTGTAPVTITGVTIAGATSADMHETKGGAMLPLPKLTLAPGEEADFVPGGRHVMVYGLPASVKAGDSLTYALQLSDGSKLAGTLQVEAAGSAAGHDMGHDMSGMKM